MVVIPILLIERPIMKRLNRYMGFRLWVKDTREGFRNLFHFMSYALGLDLILKDIKETEEKVLIKTEIE
jgi:hypothetical protein